MSVQVEEKDGNLLCIRHQEKIRMFIMDAQVPFKDTLLCPECLEERNMVCTKLISLSKAKQMIQEQIFNQNPNLNSQTQSEVKNLNILSNNLMEYKNKVIQTIDTILGIISQWIKDLDYQKNQQINKSLLQQLQQLHQGNIDDRNDEQTLVKLKNAHSKKLYNHFKKLYNQQDLNKFDQQTKQIVNQNQNELNKLINQEQEIVNVPKNCQQINNINQRECCYAIAFNKAGSIMVSGCKMDIKVQKFYKGKLTELNKLTGHSDKINCLVFSKNLNQFVSGSDDCTIRVWEEQQNNWISTQPQKQHQDWVYCLLLNSNENELISGGFDTTLKV